MAKINTAYCITAIVGYFAGTKDPVLTNPKNWKRRSKSHKCVGIAHGGDEDGNLVTRIFENVKTGKKVKVVAGGLHLPIRIDEVSNVTLSTMCRKILEEELGESISCHELIQQLNFASLPQIESDGDKENVDFENCELIGLTENSITIFAGGDWQDPVIFTAVMKDGELVYEGGAVPASSGDQPKMTTEQMLLVLYGNKRPPELKGRKLPWYESANPHEEETI